MAKANRLSITHPHRPSVGEMAPKDPPFVVKSSQELPAAQTELDCKTCKKNGEDSQVETIHDVDVLHNSDCQEDQIIGSGKWQLKRAHRQTAQPALIQRNRGGRPSTPSQGARNRMDVQGSILHVERRPKAGFDGTHDIVTERFRSPVSKV
jgi:hypothetical protein